MRFAVIAMLLIIGACSTMPARAETPVSTSSATGTPTSPSTSTPSSTATPKLSAEAPTSSFIGALVEDLDADAAVGAGDAPPRLVFLNLVPWSTADQLLTGSGGAITVPLYSAPDGTFIFEKLPPDGYTLEVVWFAGFVTPGASKASPSVLKVAFRVTDSGDVVIPDPLPKFWPGSTVPLDPDEAHLGRLDGPILLNKIDPNIVTVPVFVVGPSGPPPVGRVDVSAVLRRATTGRPVTLPSTGSPAASAGGGWREYGLAAGAATAALALSVGLRRRGRR